MSGNDMLRSGELVLFWKVQMDTGYGYSPCVAAKSHQGESGQGRQAIDMDAGWQTPNIVFLCIHIVS